MFGLGERHMRRLRDVLGVDVVARGEMVCLKGEADTVKRARRAIEQMRGIAGERQVPGDIDLALTHNVGGTGQTCAVHIYERR